MKIGASSSAPAVSFEQAGKALLAYLDDPAYERKVASLFAAIGRRFAGQPALTRYFQLWEDHGFHLTPLHYYFPIPDTRRLREQPWQAESELVGIEMNEEAQVRLLTEVFPRFQQEYDRLAAGPEEAEAGGFHFQNGVFDGTDALALYCMLRHLQPARIVEVGSGFSTRIAALALKRNGGGSIVCIEPDPVRIPEVLRGEIQLVEKPAEEAGFEIFLELGHNDVLFIDSSHVVRYGGDVNFLFLEVLPRLRPGVAVHVHDIFLPADYRQSWLLEYCYFYSEQYLLQAFLAFNSQFEVLLANSYLEARHLEKLKRTFPLSKPWWGGASFWMRRKPENGAARQEA